MGEFIHGEPPGIDPYFYVAPLCFDDFYTREYGGYQTLLCEIHLIPGYISNDDLKNNLKVASVFLPDSGGDGRVSDSGVTAFTEGDIQYVYFSVDIDMSSITNPSTDYYIYLEYNGTEVIDFSGSLGFYD